jgi:hypothetical protein
LGCNVCPSADTSTVAAGRRPAVQLTFMPTQE